MRYNALTRLRTLIHRLIVVELVRLYYNRIWGTKIGKGTRISRSVKMDKTYPAGVEIGEYSAVAFEAAILTHDFVHGQHRHTKIGSYCFIGARAVVMPGVTIGDHCVVGTGAVVMRNVPANSVVIGNPGRVIERDIETGRYGMRVESLFLQGDEQVSPAQLENAPADG